MKKILKMQNLTLSGFKVLFSKTLLQKQKIGIA